MSDVLVLVSVAVGLAALGAVIWVGAQVRGLRALLGELPSILGTEQQSWQRDLLAALQANLVQHSDRIGAHFADSGERLRGVVTGELRQTRDTLHALQLSITQSLADGRESLSQSLAQSRESLAQSLGQNRQAMTENLTLDREAMTSKLSETAASLNAKIDERLDQITGRVNERLEEGFKRTNETFVSVMQRLATIDEAQKKIETLTGNVVSLHELLGDKRARGAFGEIQLEALVRNILPPSAFEFQATLPNGTRADCILKLPQPTGTVAVDSKFPMENYHRMFGREVNEAERSLAQKQFRADIRRHVEDIAGKYIIPEATADGAVMFVPAEAVFAEIHAYHPEVVDYAQSRHVWIVSPTTLMAILNTARAVIKDVETRRQVHVIQESLVRLGTDFQRFDERMKKLADHIRMAHQDAEDVQVSSRKISQQFARIESVDLEERPALAVVRSEPGQGGAG